MSTALFRKPTPEEIELLRKRAELTALRAALTGREEELAHLRAQLFSFEGRYLRQVGVLYIQLDDWEDRLAELIASRNPTPSNPVSPPNEPTPQATPETPEATSADAPILDLKALFREVAKRIHPDFAKDHLDERRRTHLMAQANAAYLRDDASILHRMINDHDPSGNPHHEDAPTQLARVLTQIAQTRTDIDAIDAELTDLAHSQMARLKETTDRAALKGRDHLAEMAARVKGSIGVVMRRFEQESSPNRRPTSPIDPESLLSAETTPTA